MISPSTFLLSWCMCVNIEIEVFEFLNFWITRLWRLARSNVLKFFLHFSSDVQVNVFLASKLIIDFSSSWNQKVDRSLPLRYDAQCTGKNHDKNRRMSDIGIALTNGSVQVEGPWIDTTCQLRDTIAPLIESEITTGITFTLKKQVCQLLST